MASDVVLAQVDREDNLFEENLGAPEAVSPESNINHGESDPASPFSLSTYSKVFRI